MAEWDAVERVFLDVLDLDAADRTAHLDRIGAADAALRGEVESLLAAHDTAGDFLERPAAEAVPDLLDEAPGGAVPTAIGPYLVRQEIGTGGMGVVYLAEDTRLSRRVALKAIPAGRAADPAARARLRREARAAAALTHPGIATVYALEELDGELYLASEYVPGPTLRAIVSRGPQPLADVLAIARQLAAALAAAHAQGVVHRDLKPENVILTASGTVKVLDFGLARADGQLHDPEAGLLRRAGTPGYMAPEQRRGEPTDFRADIFSFGVLVSELASGRNPLTGAGAASSAIEPLASERDDAGSPRGLHEILQRCLEHEPSARYASSDALRSDLDHLDEVVRRGGGRPVRGGASGERPWPPLRWWRAHQAIVSGVYVLALLPLWVERQWVPLGGGMPAGLAALALTVVAVSVRLHLWFSTRVYPAETRAQRRRARAWLRTCDLGLASILAAVALSIGGVRPYPALLLVAVAAGVSVANLLIEPSTERAAFDRTT
ncbi:MAG: serine/threonine protein kinase [Acidimicrobiia bacterium]|nr:serine/threonine protein kinase [Acidimicrobiia bacterium]